ncbi:MAG: DUF362 domain-containing protein [Clostridia bacterium]|nr:DUF362 domain-containing protein [Clostridia bacterium]
MEKSKVYYTSMRAKVGDSLLDKLTRLIKKAGIGNIDFDGKYVAVKIHFGEPGNLAYLRPNYAKTVCDYIKTLGGKPFLTDCNTLYVGGRKNALDHLDSAYANGYNPFQTGVHTIIADGIKGTDEVLIPVEGGTYVKEAKIGRALMDADIIISMNHFKGHECAGFGGALKNLGMGGGSRAGKMEMHSAGKPFVTPDACIGCGACARVCAHDAPVIENGKAYIDHDKCVGCGRCIGVCPKDAVEASMDEKGEILNAKIAEYTQAVINGRPQFHISLVIDVSPNCDCHGENDVPIVPDIGMFASFDPVALDTACADAVLNAPIMAGSILDEVEHIHGDHFTDVAPSTAWKTQLVHAEKIGIGSMQYELIEVK